MSDTEKLPDEVEITDADAVIEAKKAWKRIQRNGSKLWDDWEWLRRAMSIGRKHALDVSGSSSPKGSRYSRAFNEWLDKNDLDEVHETTRAALLKIDDDWEVVVEWRAKLKEDERLQWNHPVTVWKKFGAHQRREGTRPQQPRKGLRAVNLDLQTQLDSALQRLQEVEAGQPQEPEPQEPEPKTIEEYAEKADRHFFEVDDLVKYIDALIKRAHARGATKTWGRKKQQREEATIETVAVASI